MEWDDDDDNDDVFGQLVRSFCDTTNATRQQARQFLEMTEGDVNAAVELFLEGSPTFPTSFPESPSFPTTTTTATTATATGMEHGRPPAYAAGGNMMDEDDVRAPIPQRQEILNPLEGYAHVPWHPFQRGRAPVRSSFEISSDNPTERHIRLAEMFQPPTELTYKRSFDEAILEARQENKWILVHMVEYGEFLSQVANRDLWKAKMVQDLVREHFIFLQLAASSLEGRIFMSKYPFESYPHIAILDPRTGERVREWHEQINALDFYRSLKDFLGRNSLEDSRLDSSSSGNNIGDFDVSALSEEDQVRLAIQKSLETQAGNGSPAAAAKEPIEIEDKDDEDSYYPLPSNGKHGQEGQQQPVQTQQQQSVQTQQQQSVQTQQQQSVQTRHRHPTVDLPVCIDEEPPKDAPDVTHIKFRLADGSQKVRRFRSTETVSHLYSCVKSWLTKEQRDQPFELLCFSQKTSDKLDMTIKDAGLSNASLTFSSNV